MTPLLTLPEIDAAEARAVNHAVSADGTITVSAALSDVPALAHTARTAIELLQEFKLERAHNRVFIASKQRIKQPEGTDLYDSLTARLDAFLAAVAQKGGG